MEEAHAHDKTWDISGEARKYVVAPTMPADLFVFSKADATHLLTPESEIASMHWDDVTGVEADSASAIKGTSATRALAISNDAKRFAVADEAGAVALWDLSERRIENPELLWRRQGHEKISLQQGDSQIVGVAFVGHRNDVLVSWGTGGDIRVWDSSIASGRARSLYIGTDPGVLQMSYDSQGSLVLMSDFKHVLSASLVVPGVADGAYFRPYESVCKFAPWANDVLACYSGARAYVYGSGQTQPTGCVDIEETFGVTDANSANITGVWPVRAAQDGTDVLIETNKRTQGWFRTRTDSCDARAAYAPMNLPPGVDSDSSQVLALNGEHLILAGQSGVWLGTLTSGQPREVDWSAISTSLSVRHAAVSETQTRFALLGSDRVEVHSIPDQTHHTLDAWNATMLAISCDGKAVAIANESSVQMVDAESGEWRSAISTLDNLRITSLAWDCRGKKLAIGYHQDGDSVFPGPPPGVEFIGFDNALHLDGTALLRDVCRSVGRDLTCNEWRTVAGSEPYSGTCRDFLGSLQTRESPDCKKQ